MRSPRVRSADRHALRFLSALFACLVALSMVAPVALAGGPNVARPPAPDRDSGTPHFVTETNDAKWDDCEWASAAMLIEKWTGDQVDRRALRADAIRGQGRLVAPRRRPWHGEPAWPAPALLARRRRPDDLEHAAHPPGRGGGAVLEGAYSRMPR